MSFCSQFKTCLCQSYFLLFFPSEGILEMVLFPDHSELKATLELLDATAQGSGAHLASFVKQDEVMSLSCDRWDCR